MILLMLFKPKTINYGNQTILIVEDFDSTMLFLDKAIEVMTAVIN